MAESRNKLRADLENEGLIQAGGKKGKFIKVTGKSWRVWIVTPKTLDEIATGEADAS